ncbi:Putative mitochondrial outer membrane translocase complex, subunit Tom70 [Septoria linicola]|uniref:Mitochondrial outer membrane translocase complex, subunit Tom70 n=1 Tax=Septoria linicola TaxID=215465 RepID=A0A9Q9EKE7_9PEZI|nr:Putative mitochondrial outer membrane translocase complex, subunit Tom70 [Septoria linicola]
MASAQQAQAQAKVEETAHAVQHAGSSFFDRVGTWYQDNKVAAWTIAGVTVVAVGGTVYYLSQPPPQPKANKKDRRKPKKGDKAAAEAEKVAEDVRATAPKTAPRAAAVAEEVPEELPTVTEDSVASLSQQDRKDFAAKLKAAGNKAYGAKEHDRAIDLYTQAIYCKADPVFYSNRAACWNAKSNWTKVIEDTTAALNLDHEYVKALNRRANAYEQEEKYSEALLDYTASCIIDQFRNESSAQAVERLLKKVAESKAKAILAEKDKSLPSPTFVSNYLQSFRAKGLPEGLEETADLPEGSGKWYLRKGLQAIRHRNSEGYKEAADAFDQAIEAGDLDKYGAEAHNMRGTFRYLRGDNDAALEDLNKSIELDATLVQSYVKRASMHLEQSAREAAANDFETAAKHNPNDPDIYYHRAQLHFILSEFSLAATDYQKSIDLDKDFIFSHIQLGVTQYKMGSIASSMATFRRCIKNFGDKSDVYNYYGELLLDQQKYQEAVEKFETAVEMEKKAVGETGGMNVLPLINKALALFQWKQDFTAAEQLCEKALLIDPECDIAVATMAQLLLQQGKVTDALEYFERAAKLSRTEGEIVNALSYAEATRTQLEVQEKYPQLAAKLHGMGAMGGPAMR